MAEILDATGKPTAPTARTPMSSAEIVEKVMMVTQHPYWELYVTQLEINAQKYADQISRGDFLEKFVAEYVSLRACEPVEVLGYARGLVYGLKLAGAMPYALRSTLETQQAADDAEAEEMQADASDARSEQGNEGDPGFRPAAHPDDLELEA